MNALILLADGFEVTEALATYDILKRSKQIHPKLVSITENLVVTSSQGIKVNVDEPLNSENENEADFYVLPGGKLGVENLGKSAEVRALLLRAKKQGKPVHAICAAPSILGNLGMLEGKDYTCFPGFETTPGWQDEGVVDNGDFVTGRSMGYSVLFGLAIVEKYLGGEVRKQVEVGVYGLKDK